MQLCSFKFPIAFCELCFVLHFHSFIVLLAVLFVDLVHCILLFALRLSRPSCNQVVSDCFWNIKLTYLLTYTGRLTLLGLPRVCVKGRWWTLSVNSVYRWRTPVKTRSASSPPSSVLCPASWTGFSSCVSAVFWAHVRPTCVTSFSESSAHCSTIRRQPPNINFRPRSGRRKG